MHEKYQHNFMVYRLINPHIIPQAVERFGIDYIHLISNLFGKYVNSQANNMNIYMYVLQKSKLEYINMIGAEKIADNIDSDIKNWFIGL